VSAHLAHVLVLSVMVWIEKPDGRDWTRGENVLLKESIASAHDRDRYASCLRARLHVCCNNAAGKSEYEIRLRCLKHGGVQFHERINTEIFMICLENFQRDAALFGPRTGKIVGTARAAINNERERSPGMQLIKAPEQGLPVLVLAATADQQFH